MTRSTTDQPNDAEHACPICGKPVRPEQALFPFCSRRCRTIDLGKWLKGDYLISRRVEESDIEETE